MTWTEEKVGWSKRPHLLSVSNTRKPELDRDVNARDGIVAGDMARRLVTSTIAQQIRGPVERVTSPFQYALSTRAGT